MVVLEREQSPVGKFCVEKALGSGSEQTFATSKPWVTGEVLMNPGTAAVTAVPWDSARQGANGGGAGAQGHPEGGMQPTGTPRAPKLYQNPTTLP